MNLLIIANIENRRVHFMTEAWMKYFGKAPIVLSYEDLFSNFNLLDGVRPDLIRIESPGENHEVRKTLIRHGLDHLSMAIPANFPEPSQIAGSVAWYKGFCYVLDSLKRKFPHIPWMNSCHDIEVMFNKPLCRHHLQQYGVTLPAALGKVESLEEIISGMNERKCSRVFIKPAHGSSASGVIALRIQESRIQALTTVQKEGGHFYNSLRLQQYDTHKQIEELITGLAGENLFAEQWIPKLMRDDSYIDFRIMLIHGTICHIVPRMSAMPITNLHLGNKKGNWENIKKTLSENILHKLQTECMNVVKAFPESLYLGVDILIDKREKDVFVLEVNAFGDLLPDVLWEGKNTWETECWFLKEDHGF